MTPIPFAERVLAWWAVHGRHDLPWQLERNAYRVWVAEVMLQQTQVTTVIGYFQCFIDHFPDLHTLAEADLDEVLALWSGLGYYARARNLHAAARECQREHAGKLPADPGELEQLPGIGRSTANAIAAQAFDHRAPILDGNVKRVLARHAGIDGWPGRSAVLKKLWAEAETRTPDNRAADYTQAIMDLGATVCTARRPACQACPVADDCVARRESRIAELPGRKPHRERPQREATLLIIEDDQGRVLLERRPPTGVWGGLWSLPAEDHAETFRVREPRPSPAPIEHAFTHFRLTLNFRHVLAEANTLRESQDTAWMSPERALASGLPRPIRQVLESTFRVARQ